MKLMDVRRLAPALFLAILLALPCAALGHAFPEKCDPKVGSTISASPPAVRVWFDSALEPLFSKITVVDETGKRVDKGDGGIDGSDSRVLKVGIPPLHTGYYRVVWEVVARDGHRTTGNYKFLVK